MIHSQRRLPALGAIGIAVLVVGVAVAMMRLPEWRNREVPDEKVFSAHLQQAARQAGLQLESEPRVQLRSKSWLLDEEQLSQHEFAYDHLGSGAAPWLTKEGRGPYVESIARGRWKSEPGASRQAIGELRVLFSLRGVPIAAMWLADDPFGGQRRGRADLAKSRRRSLMRIFIANGLIETELDAFDQIVHLAPVPGSDPPESLLGMSFSGAAMPYVQRLVGPAASWRQRLESRSLGTLLVTRLPRALVSVALFFVTVSLFVLLLARRRIELTKGAILGALSIALSLSGPIRSSANWVQLVDALGEIVVKGLALFVLWSVAESWLRSTIPGFRTSLDTLRAGRLGPTGGRALLTGSAIGAAMAGLWFLLFSVATMLPGVAPMDGSVRLPNFGATASPIDEGAIRTAFVMLAICAALRWPLVRRLRGSATILAAALLATRIPLSSFWVCLAVALLLAILLVQTYTRFGLTALLAAAMTSTVLPATLFSLLHVSWMPSSAVLLLAVAIAPVMFGAIGMRRPASVEEGALRLPGFVRRLEEENRVKYEMDLLARMQLGLLPQEMPVVDGYEIAARSILATEAGGDLYDFVADSLGRTWIAAGDVSGHGYSCAIAQAMAKAGLASLVEADRTPSMVLTRLDVVLRGIGSPRTFTSMALLRLDPITGETLLSNAGHPYPLISTDAGNLHELDLPSLPLGQGPARQYTDTAFTIERGTTLILFSDGLFEGANPAGQAYGFERIRAILAKTSRRPASDILFAILEDWRGHVGPEAPDDDTTIVVVKRKL